MRHASLTVVLVALLILPASAQVGVSGSWKIEVIRKADLPRHAWFEMPSELVM